MPSLKKNIVYKCLISDLSCNSTVYYLTLLSACVRCRANWSFILFTYSIAFYFMILSMLGISNYGNRTIAQVRTSREHLNQEFSNIYAVQLTCSLVMTVSYLIYATVFVNSFQIVAYIQVLHVYRMQQMLVGFFMVLRVSYYSC